MKFIVKMGVGISALFCGTAAYSQTTRTPVPGTNGIEYVQSCGLYGCTDGYYQTTCTGGGAYGSGCTTVEVTYGCAGVFGPCSGSFTPRPGDPGHTGGESGGYAGPQNPISNSASVSYILPPKHTPDVLSSKRGRVDLTLVDKYGSQFAGEGELTLKVKTMKGDQTSVETALSDVERISNPNRYILRLLGIGHQGYEIQAANDNCSTETAIVETDVDSYGTMKRTVTCDNK